MKFKAIFLYLLIFNFIICLQTQGVNRRKSDFDIIKIEKFFYNISQDIKEQVVYNNYSFYVKTWNRRVQTLNLYAILKKPITRAYFWLSLFYKGNSDNFRKVITAPKFEACEILKTSTSNILVKQLFDFIEKSIPGFLHQCPYTSLVFHNVTLPKHEVMNLVPSGNFQITIELAVLTTDIPDIYILIEFALKDLRTKTAKNSIVKLQNFVCNFNNETFEKYLHENSTCGLKVWNRRIPTINVYFSFKQLINKIFIEIIVKYKKSENDLSKKVIQTPEFELCSTIQSSTENNFIKKIMELVKSTFPRFVGCPYDSWTAINATVPDHPIFNFLTSGFYHIIVELRLSEKDLKDITFHTEAFINSINDRLRGN